MEKYVNYYNGDNTNITFEFEEMTKEEAERIQAYMLQDSHLIIYDEDVLSKISEESEEVVPTRSYMRGTLVFRRDPEDKGHISFTGTSENTDYSGEVSSYKYRGNIFEGLNFVAVLGIREDTKTNYCKFSSINWFHDKVYNPNVIVRSNIRTESIGDNPDKWDLEKEDLEYAVADGFDVTKNPTSEFIKGKKSVKVKKK